MIRLSFALIVFLFMSLQIFATDANNGVVMQRKSTKTDNINGWKPDHYIVGATPHFMVSKAMRGLKDIDLKSESEELCRHNVDFVWTNADEVKAMRKQNILIPVLISTYADIEARRLGADPLGNSTYFADPVVMDAMVTKATILACHYKGDNSVFGIGGLDEPWGAKNAILGDKIDRTKGFPLEAFTEIQQRFGNGSITAPKSSLDVSALSWIAFNRWYDSQFQQLQRRLYNGIKQADPNRLLFSHNFFFLRCTPVWDYDALGKYFDVAMLDPYTGKIEAESPDRAIFHTGFSTKLVADLTGKPVLPMPHFMQYWRKYPTAKEIIDYSSEALRCGAAGLFYILVDWGPYKYIRYPESGPERWNVLMQISDYLHATRRLKFPKTSTLVLFPTDSYAAFNETLTNEVYVAHALLGEGAKVWYRFISDRQIERDKSVLEGAKILYVPYAPYIETSVVKRIVTFVKDGGTVVLGDSSVFKFRPNGDSIDAGVRQELLPPASQDQIEKWPGQRRLPEISIYRVGQGRVILMSENPFILENVTNGYMVTRIKKIQKLVGEDGMSDVWKFSLPKNLSFEAIK